MNIFPMIFVKITDLCASGSPREKSLVVARFDLDYLVSILSLSRFITFKYNLGIGDRTYRHTETTPTTSNLC